jgi:hypothetical protein
MNENANALNKQPKANLLQTFNKLTAKANQTPMELVKTKSTIKKTLPVI